MTPLRKSVSKLGVTFAELMIGFAVFGILMGLLAAILVRSSQVWTRASSSTASQAELRKAFTPVSIDLNRTEFSSIKVAKGPISVTGFDGDALWFLSAVDPVSGEVQRTDDGRPLWQRNILYYTVIPNKHDELYGFHCTGGVDGQGYEVQCPHKILVRKVIDNPPATTPGGPAETLLTDITPYLTRPNGLTPSTQTQAGLEDTTFKSRSLVTFRAQLAPNPNWPNEVRILISSARIEEVKKLIQIGSASLDGYLNAFTFSVFPPEGETPTP